MFAFLYLDNHVHYILITPDKVNRFSFKKFGIPNRFKNASHLLVWFFDHYNEVVE